MTGQLNISSGGLLVSGNVNVRSSGATNGLVFIDTVNNRLGIGLNVAPYQFLSTLHVYGDANITNGIVTSNINVTTVNTTTINASTVLTNSGINVSAQAADAYVQANTARGTANDAYSAANTKLASAGGTLSGDLIITGNLTVSGNQTILNTEVLTTEDADIILLSNTSSTPALNAGLIINRGTSTNTFLRWDEATDKWGWSDSGTTTYYFEDLRQGLSTTNTTFATINTSLGTINTSYQAAYSQANTAGTNSLNAYGQANTARDTANSAYGQANAAYSQANSAYGAANNRVLKAGDTMTGQLNISSGGLLVTGNVGIGTASPSQKLHVVGDARVGAAAEGGSAAGNLYIAGNRLWRWIAGYSPDYGIGNGFGLYDDTGGAYRWMVDTSGNVGIGTTAPYSQLHLTGAVTMGSGTNARPALKITNWGYSASYRALLIGSAATGHTTANTGAVTIAFNYDPSVNGNGSFTGDGREIIFRRGTRFVTPNSSDNAYNLTNLVLYDSSVGIGTDAPAGLWSGDERVLHLSSSGGTAAGIRISSVNATAEFFSSAGSIEWGLYSNSASPFTIYTNSSERLRITSGGNIGIGTSSVDYGKVHIKDGGITAAAISTGWPAYNAETATQSKYVLFLDAGSNGSVTSQGQGPSATLAMGGYYDSRGIITMIGAGGGSPSDGGTGYGKDLMVKGGNSDNGNGYVGGRLFLAGGSGYSGGAYNANYGPVVMQPQGGNVGIGTASPTGKLNVYVDADTNISIGEHPSYGTYNAIWTPSNDYVLLWQNGGHTFLNSRGSGDIFFREDNNNLMTILNGGNVGIGTASPTGKLHIYDTSNQSSDATLYIQSPSNNDFGIKVAKTGYDYGIVVEVDSSASYGISIYAGGSYVFRATGGGNLLLTGTLTESSSIELKENIDPITNALDSITKLVGVTYDRKDGSAQNRAGLIAEEVGQILPNVVNGSGIQYTNLIAYLVESIKELKAEIDVLKSK